MATISKENYLKAIYSLSNKISGDVSTSLLAKELNISNAATSEMANKLSKQNFVDYKKYKGIKLLSKGKEIAVDVIRKHRLWELFLIDSLGLNWSEVHIEAERLEHCTTGFLIDKIDEHLNFPKTDPHGEPIPNKDGNYRIKAEDKQMSKCEVGYKYGVSRVNDRDPALIRYLSEINISLNKEIFIKGKLSFDGSIIIEVDGVSHSLSEKLANNIFLSQK